VGWGLGGWGGGVRLAHVLPRGMLGMARTSERGLYNNQLWGTDCCQNNNRRVPVSGSSDADPSPSPSPSPPRLTLFLTQRPPGSSSGCPAVRGATQRCHTPRDTGARRHASCCVPQASQAELPRCCWLLPSVFSLTYLISLSLRCPQSLI